MVLIAVGEGFGVGVGTVLAVSVTAAEEGWAGAAEGDEHDVVIRASVTTRPTERAFNGPPG